MFLSGVGVRVILASKNKLESVPSSVCGVVCEGLVFIFVNI